MYIFKSAVLRIATIISIAANIACGLPTTGRLLPDSSKSCEAIWYGDPSENQHCYDLQKRLYEAVSRNDIREIEGAIKDGANVNGGYRQSLPVLELAASEGRDEALLYVIRMGAKINKVRSFGETALKVAVIHKHRKAAKLLIENGADVCEKTEASALDYAVAVGDQDLVELLVEAGAKDCR